MEREIFNIATAKYLTQKIYTNEKIIWQELKEKLSKTTYTDETQEEYLLMDKTQQGRIKDVGGFVGGFLMNGKRSKENVSYRSLIALDLDECDNNVFKAIDNFKIKYGYSLIVYSTHKHTSQKPRLRIVLPLDKDVSKEDYILICENICNKIGKSYFDISTCQAERIMFYPSTSKGAEFYFDKQDGVCVNTDEVLKECEIKAPQQENGTIEVKQSTNNNNNNILEDPRTKNGIIGLWCRTYNIYDVLNIFLTDVYKPKNKDHYTLIGAGTSGGLLILENGLWCKSYHNKDKEVNNGHNFNSFDLVRVKKFGGLDANIKTHTRTDRTPSYIAMSKFAMNDKRVKETLLKEAKMDFGGDNNEWISQLDLDKQGNILPTLNNEMIILKNDERINNIFSYDYLRKRRYIENAVWNTDKEKRLFDEEEDTANLSLFYSQNYNIDIEKHVRRIISLAFSMHVFNSFQLFLENLPQWDNVVRVKNGKILSDYLGTDDKDYSFNGSFTGEYLTCHLLAAINRALLPQKDNTGYKWDYILVLQGEQGIGKSHFLEKLSCGFYSNGLHIKDIGTKEANITAQGYVIYDIGELAGIHGEKGEQIKDYLSSSKDIFIKKYQNNNSEFVRRCVFFGTTNKPNFLQNDNYGNRRFIVFKTHKEQIKKRVFEDLQRDEVLQLWAEVYYYYKQGMSTLLSDDLQQASLSSQEQMQEVDVIAEIINEKIEQEVPAGFEYLPDEQKRNYYDNGIIYENTNIDFSKMQKRDFFSAKDIYNDILSSKFRTYNSKVGSKINAVMRSNKNFQYVNTHKGGLYWRGFERINKISYEDIAKAPQKENTLDFQAYEELKSQAAF
jgi:predicted P-loop ATPase